MTWMNPNLCKDCDNPPREGKTRCASCASKGTVLAIKRYNKKKSKGLCTQGSCPRPPRPGRTTCAECALKKKRPTPEQAAARIEQIKRRRQEDSEYRKRSNECTRKGQRKLLALVFQKYGNRCNNSICNWVNLDGTSGCTDIRCLQIDHVNGGGVREAKALSYTVRLRRYLNDISGAYQLLCANCNWIKRSMNNEQKKRPLN